MMPSRCCIQYVSKSRRPSSGHKTRESQSSFQFPKRVVLKNVLTIRLISCASKVMLKILHARLQHYVNQALSDVQAGFREGRGTRDQIANICWIIEKARELRKKKKKKKKTTLISSTTPKPLTVWIIINCGKLLKI